MKAIIPCAGRGTRLRPLTFANAKPVIPIANKPLVVYAIEAIKETGVTEFGIVVGDNLSDIKKVLGDGSQLGISVTYIYQEDPKGVAHTIQVSKEFLQDDDFVMYLGDNLFQHGIAPAVETFRQSQSNAVLVLKETDKPEAFGIAVVKDNNVVQLLEKPKHPPTNLAAVGVYVFDKSIHPIVDQLKPSARGELEITDAIQGLIDNGSKVEHCVLDGWWMDAGNPDDLLETNRLVLNDIKTQINGTIDEKSELIGEVIIGKGSVIENSAIRGPVIIGENCRIQNSYVGHYTSVASSCELLNCEVEYSIIMNDSEIKDIEVRLDKSILGNHVTVSTADMRPKSYQLILSDNSVAQLR
jgi:glucose-1-phosphate thymidylyltransferase